jgi:uncharacterized spore protein YtfJ
MTREDVYRLFPVENVMGEEIARIDENLTMSVSDLTIRFSDTETTFESLVSHPNSTDAWKAIWERLKDEGLLN